MTSGRRVLPTDLLALVAHNGRVYPNEARTRERLGSAEAYTIPLETSLERVLPFVSERNTWISAHRQRLQGLVSARRRGGRQAWEIDSIIDTTKTFSAVPGLLDCAIAEAGKGGGERVFLRLAADSPLLPVVRSAGFVPYVYEVLYLRESPAAETECLPVRPFSQQDVYPAYRLYSSITPEGIRRSEAATFGEWNAAQERHWLKNGIQLVQDRDGQVVSWVKAAALPQGLLLDLVLQEEEVDRVEGLIASASKAAGRDGPLLVLAPQCAIGLGAALEKAGFEARQHFVSLMRRTTQTVKLKKLVPAIGNTAVVT